MNRPRIRVDFNELLEPDLILLSKYDETEDSTGNRIQLNEGLFVSIYEFNQYESGEMEYILAEGTVVLNSFQHNPIAKWCCRINDRGITVESAKV